MRAYAWMTSGLACLMIAACGSDKFVTADGGVAEGGRTDAASDGGGGDGGSTDASADGDADGSFDAPLDSPINNCTQLRAAVEVARFNARTCQRNDSSQCQAIEDDICGCKTPVADPGSSATDAFKSAVSAFDDARCPCAAGGNCPVSNPSRTCQSVGGGHTLCQ